MTYITFSLPNQIIHLTLYNFAYPLNILMVMSLFYYSILQLEPKSIANKKINICLLFKDFFQIIVFISFYFIEKNKSKLTKREITLLVDEKLDDKVVLTRQTLFNNPDESLELKLQKDKKDIIRISFTIIFLGISDFLNEKLLYVFGPSYDFFREIYFIFFICLNYLSIYFTNKFLQNKFSLYKHKLLSLIIILIISFLYFLTAIIMICLISTYNKLINIIYLIIYSFPISIMNGIKFVLQKELLEKDFKSEFSVLSIIGVVKLFLHFFSNIFASNYFRYLDGFSNFFSENIFLFLTIFCSIIFIASSLLGDYCLIHILYMLSPNHSLLAIQTGIFFLFVIHFLYLVCFGGSFIISNFILLVVLLILNFFGLIYNEIVVLKFRGYDLHTKLSLKINEQMDKKNYNLIYPDCISDSVGDSSASYSALSK